MRNLLIILGALLAAVIVFTAALVSWIPEAYLPQGQPEALPFLDIDQELMTVNTARIGSDDPVETAVAVAQIIYPATEEENTPGAVILVNRHNLAEALVATSRVQHFPVNAPILYVDEHSIPAPTHSELLRLQPEGVPADGNVQVYLVGSIGAEVRTEVEAMGYSTRLLTAPTPPELAEIVDDWSSTQHADHRNEIAIINLDDMLPGIPSAFWNAHRGDGLAFVTNDGIPDATRRMLERRAHGPWLYLFGDESVIPAAIARELAQYGQVTRMRAPDFPGTSAFFAGFHDEGADWGAWWWMASRTFGWGISEAGHNAIFVNADGPGGWQNVLPATTLSHMGKHAPVLAVNADGVPPAVADYLAILKPYPSAPQQQLLNHGWIIGGEETISWQTQTTLDVMLDAYVSEE
ncbi:MAG: cell wall-binding repeat-containing protein [Anaerolineales bacterium]|nr:cell wall-binding repeat-containing protein [Anaerolineales bacterium]